MGVVLRLHHHECHMRGIQFVLPEIIHRIREINFLAFLWGINLHRSVEVYVQTQTREDVDAEHTIL